MKTKWMRCLPVAALGFAVNVARGGDFTFEGNVTVTTNLAVGATAVPTNEPPGSVYVAGNLSVTGTVTAVGFVGDGSGLTDLAATALPSELLFDDEMTVALDLTQSSGALHDMGGTPLVDLAGRALKAADGVTTLVDLASGTEGLHDDAGTRVLDLTSAGKGLLFDDGTTPALSVASGSEALYFTDGTPAIDLGNKSYHAESLAIGEGAVASGQYAFAQGMDVEAAGDYSSAMGIGSTAWGMGSHAQGLWTTSTVVGAHAEGKWTQAGNDSGTGGWYAHAEGRLTKATGDYSHAEGDRTIASGEASHAEGNDTVASGITAHAEGYYTTAAGFGAHAEGGNTEALGDFSHAQGKFTRAVGDYSHAQGMGFSELGLMSEAWGEASHVEGISTYTSVDAIAAHAEGSGTAAFGIAAHAEGGETVAAGYYSHAQGFRTMALGDFSHAAGRNARASHNSTYVWSSSGATVNSTAANQFTVYASGGIRLLGGVIEGDGSGLYNLATNPFGESIETEHITDGAVTLEKLDLDGLDWRFLKRDGSVAMTGTLNLNGNWISGDGDPEGLSVDPSGNVGVGTSTPVATLDVVGSARISEGIKYIAPLGNLSMGAFTSLPPL